MLPVIRAVLARIYGFYYRIEVSMILANTVDDAGPCFFGGHVVFKELRPAAGCLDLGNERLARVGLDIGCDLQLCPRFR